MNKIKTIDIEIRVMQWLDIRANLVVPNVHWGMDLHECDLLNLTKSGYATEVEIKVSKSDLLKDRLKRHGHVSDKIKYLYYAVPAKLKDLALTEIPERAGLLVISETGLLLRPFSLVVARKPILNKKAKKWSDKERLQLARLGAMRILGLKQKIRG